MTIVRIGRKDSKDFPMEFPFDNTMDAFTLYAIVKDHYREDDLFVDMTEEGDCDGYISEEC